MRVPLFLLLFLLGSVSAFAQFTATTSIGASQEDWNSAGAWSFPTGFNPNEGYPDKDFDEDVSTAAFNGDYGKFIIIDVNDNIKIPNNVVIDLRNSGITQITLKSGSILEFGSNSKLMLPASAIIVFETGATLFTHSNSSGTYLEIGGNGVWGRGCEGIGCNNDDLTGPGVITKDSTPGSPLPVTLLYFVAFAEKNYVQLNWATASELNFDRFVIEKTRDGQTFIEIGERQGAGLSNTRIDYSFKDEKIMMGRTYYRLKAIDFDGFTEYFGMVSAFYEGVEDINVFPNPTSNGDVNIYLNYFSEEPVYCKVADVSGAEVYTGIIVQTGFDNKYTIEKTFSPGMYFLEVRTGLTKKVIRFVVN